MKNLDLKEKAFGTDSIIFREQFDFVAEKFFTSLNSNSIRGFVSTFGYNGCSIFAASIFRYFDERPRVNSLTLFHGRKFGDEKDYHTFIAYRRMSSILIHFRNFRCDFVNVIIYSDGDYSVHFLK